MVENSLYSASNPETNPSGLHPLFIFLRGLPGSGKSTLIKYLQNNSKYFDTTLFLDPDKVNSLDEKYINFCEDLNNKGIPQTVHKYRFMLKNTILSLTSGKNVIWDQPWTTLQGIDDTIYNINYHLSEHITQGLILPRIGLIELAIPSIEAAQRVKDRKLKGGHGPTPNTFVNFINRYEPINNSLKIPILRINGLLESNKSAQIVLKFLDHLSQ